jgi:O-antigen/teichoic acid export membrane protein
MIAITIPILSRSWKDKNLVEIERIYKRSSINLLSFSLFAFFLIWLNFNDGIQLLGINAEYLEGKTVFLLLGIVAIIEMGTGVNGQIIGTSTMWSFELWTSLLLTCLIIPLSYYLTVKYGLVGPALANLVSFSVYNAVRLYFLWKKYRMQPFSIKTIEVLLIAAFSYLTCLLFNELHGLSGILLKSILFILLFLTGIYVRNVSADIRPIINNLLLRVGIKGKE